ncbi:MAG: flavin reductase family protein [Chloroflexota bacterium]
MKEQIPLSNAHRLINVGCIVLITATAKGRTNVMPAAWVSPVSQRPPLVAVSIAVTSFTHDLIARSNEFVLNVPGAELVKQVMTMGTVSGRDADKLKQSGLHLAPPKVVSAPLIAECLGHLECAVANRITVGDHSLFIGEVLAAWAEKDAFDQFWRLEHRELKPLHHLGANTFSVLEQPFQV